MSNFVKLIKKNSNIIALVAIVVVVCWYCYKNSRESMTLEEEEEKEQYENAEVYSSTAPHSEHDDYNENASARKQCSSSPALQELEQASCFPQSQLSPEELLPKSSCNTWSENSGQLSDRNFLQAGWATGISAVGQTKRNSNLQLRSEVPNPQVTVSPWMQSTISPDLMRKPLEMGGCS